MDNIEKDFKRAGLSLHGISTGRNRVRLEELVGDKERWKDITAAAMAGRAFRMAIQELLVSKLASVSVGSKPTMDRDSHCMHPLAKQLKFVCHVPNAPL